MASPAHASPPPAPIRIVAAGTAALLDLDMPHHGLVVATGSAATADELLALDLRTPCGTSDRWTRGHDVVGVYEPADERRLRATAMWRPCTAVGGAAWEVVVSAQTALEHSDASLAITCDLAADALLWANAAAGSIEWRDRQPEHAGDAAAVLLRRRGTNQPSVLIAGFPGDARRMTADARDGRVRVSCSLFSSAAEKGVLFRGRVLAALGPADTDTPWATAAWQRYAATPPMLTT